MFQVELHLVVRWYPITLSLPIFISSGRGILSFTNCSRVFLLIFVSFVSSVFAFLDPV